MTSTSQRSCKPYENSLLRRHQAELLHLSVPTSPQTFAQTRQKLNCSLKRRFVMCSIRWLNDGKVTRVLASKVRQFSPLRRTRTLGTGQASLLPLATDPVLHRLLDRPILRPRYPQTAVCLYSALTGPRSQVPSVRSQMRTRWRLLALEILLGSILLIGYARPLLMMNSRSYLLRALISGQDAPFLFRPCLC